MTQKRMDDDDLFSDSDIGAAPLASPVDRIGDGEYRRTQRAFALGWRFHGRDGAQPRVAFEECPNDVAGRGGPQRRPC